MADIVDEVSHIAELGLGGAWWAERHTADALTASTVAGPRLPLGTAVVTTYPRHPLTLASQALSVQAAIGNHSLPRWARSCCASAVNSPTERWPDGQAHDDRNPGRPAD